MTTGPTSLIASLRVEYADRGLTAEDLGPDPTAAFAKWHDAAATAGLHEPNAMVVSTVDGSAVSSRMVLLKGVDQRGFVFYTNTESRKGHELAVNPACALLFPWHPLERQVRIEGTAALVSAEEADRYFASRPRGSQLGAWASPQSEVVSGRPYLAERYQHEADRFTDAEVVPRPPQWSGYRVRPHRIEFWQGRPGRMHDRIVFERVGDETWAVERLAP
ncbi:MAG: pyridoxamine 5'-phosphate oxidase [Nocardioidaceae bacterium]|nr:pyridoxamine 5'-phosphate oxidase [Nocardioidaceae bacterium]